MFSLIYVELKPTWVPVGSSAYRHQVHEGHRWSISHASPEKIERPRTTATRRRHYYRKAAGLPCIDRSRIDTDD